MYKFFFLLTSFATLSHPTHPFTYTSYLILIFSPSYRAVNSSSNSSKKSESENLTLRWWFYENVKGVVDVLCCVLKSERKNFHSCSCYSASFYGQAFPIFFSFFLSLLVCVFVCTTSEVCWPTAYFTYK